MSTGQCVPARRPFPRPRREIHARPPPLPQTSSSDPTRLTAAIVKLSSSPHSVPAPPRDCATGGKVA
ncbi:hypothetical protein E2562_031397, partial [Oryza meyeriana var. granulata]